MATAATAHVAIHLPSAEIDRIVARAEAMLRDGWLSHEVKRWMVAEVGKSVTVR